MALNVYFLQIYKRNQSHPDIYAPEQLTAEELNPSCWGREELFQIVERDAKNRFELKHDDVRPPAILLNSSGHRCSLLTGKSRVKLGYVLPHLFPLHD